MVVRRATCRRIGKRSTCAEAQVGRADVAQLEINSFFFSFVIFIFFGLSDSAGFAESVHLFLSGMRPALLYFSAGKGASE